MVNVLRCQTLHSIYFLLCVFFFFFFLLSFHKILDGLMEWQNTVGPDRTAFRCESALFL